MLLGALIRNKCRHVLKSLIRSSQIIKFCSMEKKEEVKTQIAAPVAPVVPVVPAPEAQAPKEEKKALRVMPVIPTIAIPSQSFSGRIRLRHLMLNSAEYIDKVIFVTGWARTLRSSKKVAFVELTDGSGPLGLQVVISKDVDNFAELTRMRAGCCLGFKGKVVKSPGAKQSIEMQVNKEADHMAKIYGECPAEEYPLAKKEHTMEV